MSAEQRREHVITAAISEFASHGFHGTPTKAIANRVGVSQPYLFRLFPDKRAIFLAASTRCLEETRRDLEEAAGGLENEEAHQAMVKAYTALVTQDPVKMQFHIQMYATAAASEATSAPKFAETIRRNWTRLSETVYLALGADANTTTSSLSHGMLVNALAAMRFPPEHRIWDGLHTSAQAKQPPQDGPHRTLSSKDELTDTIEPTR